MKSLALYKNNEAFFDEVFLVFPDLGAAIYAALKAHCVKCCVVAFKLAAAAGTAQFAKLAALFTLAGLPSALSLYRACRFVPYITFRDKAGVWQRTPQGCGWNCFALPKLETNTVKIAEYAYKQTKPVISKVAKYAYKQTATVMRRARSTAIVVFNPKNWRWWK